MSTNKWLAVGLAVVASTVSSVAGPFAWTEKAGNESEELAKLMTLISYDTPPGLTYSNKDLTVSFEAKGVACVIDFITKDETERGKSFELTDLGFLSGYDSIFAAVKYGQNINWFEFSPTLDSITFTTGYSFEDEEIKPIKPQDISHITYFGMICEDDDTPGEKVSDSGSVLALLGGGLLGLAGIRRRLNR